VTAALSLGTLDHSRHGWLGKPPMASTLTLLTQPTQAGIVTFVHATATAPAAAASSAQVVARLRRR